MVVWDTKIFWCVMLLLTGAAAEGESVYYPDPVCAVEGSTVTIFCTFTPVQDRGRPSEVVRVRWCLNHGICQGGTPNVFDSESSFNDPRFKYLGDKKTNCSLQITDVQKEDNGTLRFRVEAKKEKLSFTGTTGVQVSVPDVVQMEITSSSANRLMRGGENISLLCTTRCSFHQLKVTWFRDGHALSESGPALHINHLTAKDSGNYTCGLANKDTSVSLPYSLRVEEEGGAGGAGELPLIIGVVFGVLLLVFTLVLVVCIIRRRRRGQRAAGDLKSPDAPQRADEGGLGHRQAVVPADEDISYMSVQFKQQNQSLRAAKQDDDAVIYSLVSSRS